MKAITVWQPWASLIAVGAKDHETRSWGTHYHGPILIHAARHWTLRSARLCYSEPFFSVLSMAGYRFPARCDGARLATLLPLGAVVAVADLVDCRPTTPKLPTTQPAEPFSQLDREFGDWSPGRFAWRMARVRALREPLECPGAQGIWTPSRAVVDAALSRAGEVVPS